MINPYNWQEFKTLWIEAMILACLIECCKPGDLKWACCQAYDEVIVNRERFIQEGMPSEFYADLVVTMREKMAQLPAHYRETTNQLRELREELSKPE